MDDADTIQPGDEVGHYRLLRVIGRGGFGITYEAWDSSLNRQVAIKEYFPNGIAQRAGDGTVVQVREEEQFTRGLGRFLDEARTLAQFHDPRIVRVHGFLQARNTAYMVMDMERGTLLREQVQQHGSLTPEDARRVLSDILHALQVIHTRHYLHRDIKPGNLMRRPDGQVVLLDFGSARVAQADAGKGHTVVVTPGYAPIEQYNADTSQGPAIDLYATGASLLFCLTGQAPPDGLRRAVAIQANEPDPIEPLLRSVAGRGALAAELCDIVRWMMRPQAAQRPLGAQAVLDRLQRTQTHVPVPPAAAATGVNLAEMRSIPSRFVEPMRLLLEREVGAEATPLLFGSLRTSRSAQDFIDRVAARFTEDEQRIRVAEGLRRILAEPSSTRRTAVPPAPAAPAASPLADEKTTQLLANELAKHIGPIANMLVKRSVATSASRKDLVTTLAAEIPDDTDRAAFLKAVERIPAFAG